MIFIFQDLLDSLIFRLEIRLRSSAVNDLSDYKLQVILLDILEVAVCANLKLSTCSLIADDDTLRMVLQSRESPSVAYRLLDSVVQSASLLVANSQNDNLASRENCADTNRKSQLGDLRYVVVEEARVDDDGILSFFGRLDSHIATVRHQ